MSPILLMRLDGLVYLLEVIALLWFLPSIHVWRWRLLVVGLALSALCLALHLFGVATLVRVVPWFWLRPLVDGLTVGLIVVAFTHDFRVHVAPIFHRRPFTSR